MWCGSCDRRRRHVVDRLVLEGSLVSGLPDMSVTSTCVALRRSVRAVLSDSSVMDVALAIVVVLVVFRCLPAFNCCCSGFLRLRSSDM